jgi:WD40 repeat protein
MLLAAVGAAAGLGWFASTERAAVEMQAKISATQSSIATTQASIAEARLLAAQAEAHLNNRPDLALLLALEGEKLDSNAQTRNSLLRTLAHSPHLLRFLHGHSEPITSVAVNPAGTVLASGDQRGRIVLWDAATYRPLDHQLPAPDTDVPVTSLRFSPGGEMLAVSRCRRSADCESGEVQLWEVATARLLHKPSAEGVNSLAFSPDGAILAMGLCGDLQGGSGLACYGGKIVLWDVQKQRPFGQPMLGHSDEVLTVAFSPDGKTLASGGGNTDPSIILWDVAKGRPIGKPLSRHTGSINSVAFSPDGATLASASSDSTLILWNLNTHEPRQPPLLGHSSSVQAVAFSSSGKLLASSGGPGDSNVVLWDATTGTMLDKTLRGHNDGVMSLAFYPDDSRLLSGGGRDGIVWDVASKDLLAHTLESPGKEVRSLALSPDGRILASGQMSSTITLWNTETLNPIGQPLQVKTSFGIPADVDSLAFSPDNKTLISMDSNEIQIWEAQTGRLISKIDSETDCSISMNDYLMALRPDGKVLAYAGGTAGGHYLDFCDVPAVKYHKIDKPDYVDDGYATSIAFSPDGKVFASGSGSGSIYFWDTLNEHKILAKLPQGHSRSVTSLVFSPDSTLLASTSYDRSIILWDVASRTPLGPPLVGHTSAVNKAAFSPDGTTLASVGDDGQVILWDVQSRQIIATLQGHTKSITGVVFSPDGHTLITGSEDTTVMVWDMNVASWREHACQRANRNLSRFEFRAAFGDSTPYHKTCPAIPDGE